MKTRTAQILEGDFEISMPSELKNYLQELDIDVAALLETPVTENEDHATAHIRDSLDASVCGLAITIIDRWADRQKTKLRTLRDAGP